MVEEKQQQQSSEKKEKLTLKVEQPYKFGGFFSTCPVKSTNLSRDVHELLSSFFCDVLGAKIIVDPNRNYQPSLIVAFKENLVDSSEDARFHGIERIINKNNNDQISTIKTLQRNNIIGGSHYKLTDDLKELLEDVVPSYAYNQNTHKVNWKIITKEESVNNVYNNYGQNYAIVSIALDLNRMCKYLFGADSDSNGHYHYMVSVGNIMNPMYNTSGAIVSGEWTLFIHRIDDGTMNKVANDMGYGIINNLGFN